MAKCSRCRNKFRKRTRQPKGGEKVPQLVAEDTDRHNHETLSVRAKVDGSGGRGKKKTLTEQIPEGLQRTDKETRTIRAKTAGTNRALRCRNKLRSLYHVPTKKNLREQIPQGFTAQPRPRPVAHVPQNGRRKPQDVAGWTNGGPGGVGAGACVKGRCLV